MTVNLAIIAVFHVWLLCEHLITMELIEKGRCKDVLLTVKSGFMRLCRVI